MPATETRLAGLDGLRALAVAAVILYHLALPGVAPAGFLGVDVFFTISGFIITALLLREHARTGRIDFAGFYARRARRLLPPTLALIAVVATLSPWLAPQSVQRLATDIPAALLYGSNWWQIHSQQSYFEAFGNPPVLQHLWSLAVEEQFYIAWPLCVLALLRVAGRRGLALASLAGALASTAWMAWLYVQLDGGDPSRVYLGTDTHLMGLLAGSALACVFNPWPRGAVPPRRTATGARAAWTALLRLLQALWVRAAGGGGAGRERGANNVLGLAALAGLVAMMVLLTDAEPFVYQGGFLLAALLSCALVVASTQTGTWLNRALLWPVVQWAGTRSFSLYLWHWPALVWIKPVVHGPAELAAVTVARLAVTVVSAEISYRLIEQPLRHGGQGLGARATVRALGLTHPRALLAGGLVGVVSTVLLLAGTPAAVSADAHRSDGHRADFLATTTAAWPPAVPGAPAAVRDGRPGPLVAAEPDVADRAAARSMTPAAIPAATPADATTTTAVAEARSADCVNVIGDSVMLGASDHLRRTLAGARVDAEVGRQGSAALRVLRQFRADARLCNTVVVHLGTNGYLAESHYREMLKQVQDRQVVVLINVRAERQWTPANNAMIERVSHDFANIRVVDWHAVSDKKPEFFVADGVHLTNAGIKAISHEIRVAAGLPEPLLQERPPSPRRRAPAPAGTAPAGAESAVEAAPAASAAAAAG